MPKMRILSGAQAGAIVDMDLPEAQSAYCSGFAEQVEEKQAKAEAEPKEEPAADKGAKAGKKPKGR